MAKAIFTFSEGSDYDDKPEERYHFPGKYKNQVEQCIGDLIVYYEPRRDKGPKTSGGRQAYFASARVTSVVEDISKPGHYYANITDYLPFDHPVPFKVGQSYYETSLLKQDGGTNKGKFGWSVRLIPEIEFEQILRAGFVRDLDEWERRDNRVAEPEAIYDARPLITTIITRPFRDQVFKRLVREAYRNTCAISGLSLINGGGRPEVQAAHIKSVAAQGPDSVRNGLALTGTVHWLFDRGLISISDDYRVLVSGHGVPEEMARLIRPERSLILPKEQQFRPHPTYLAWHRDNCFKP